MQSPSLLAYIDFIMLFCQAQLNFNLSNKSRLISCFTAAILSISTRVIVPSFLISNQMLLDNIITVIQTFIAPLVGCFDPQHKNIPEILLVIFETLLANTSVIVS